MVIDKSMEKQYTLLIEGLSLEEKSWLYQKAKRENKGQGLLVLGFIREKMLADSLEIDGAILNGVK